MHPRGSIKASATPRTIRARRAEREGAPGWKEGKRRRRESRRRSGGWNQFNINRRYTQILSIDLHGEVRYATRDALIVVIFQYLYYLVYYCAAEKPDMRRNCQLEEC